MFIKKTEFKKLILYFAILVFVINIILMINYIFVGYKQHLHADAANKVILAKEILETGDYFPNDWYYVNKDIFVLFGHTFIVPLLLFFPPGYFVHAVSGLVSVFILLLSVWLITGLVNISKSRRLFIVSAFAGGVSGFTCDSLIGHVSYTHTIYLNLFIIILSNKLIISHNKLFSGCILSLFVAILFWSNPLRGIASTLIPLIFATGILSIGLDYCKNRSSLVLLIVFSLFGSFVGYLLHAWTLSGVHNVTGVGAPVWISYDSTLFAVKNVIRGLISIFGGEPRVGEQIVCGRGIFEAARLFIPILIMILLPISINNAIKNGNLAYRYIAAYATSALFIALFFQIFSSVPDPAQPIASARYLLQPMLMLLLVILMAPFDWINSPIKSSLIFLITIILNISGYTTYILSSPDSSLKCGPNIGAENKLDNLSKYLLEKNLTQGYATYWNAGPITLFSDGKCKIRPVGIADGMLSPFRHHSSNRWYTRHAWSGRCALILTKNESKTIDWDKINLLNGFPEFVYEKDEYLIYVYSENIAKNMSPW